MSAPTVWAAPGAGTGKDSNSTMGGDGPIENELTPEVRAKVAKGLEWLAKHQSADGSFAEGGGDNSAIAALAGLAFLADGNMPGGGGAAGEGQYGANVDKVLEFTLKNCQESGLIAANGYGSPMYGHGFATLFLAEAYGMTQRADVKEKLQNAIRLLVQTQNREGGWRYQPAPMDADLSVTICEIMALRAARNAGIKIPKITIDRAIDYVKKSQEPDGGFCYTIGSRGATLPLTGAGVVCLYYAGIYQGSEITKGLKYLMEHGIPGKSSNLQNHHYYYGNYYETQAMFMAGGNAWQTYWPAIRAELLKKQTADGSWTGESGPAYATAMACIILQVPNRLLPILQK
ncbi:MAG: prenyltransferase/squalene oxidase repeat-containing protein [Phycisphaerae bacterium]